MTDSQLNWIPWMPPKPKVLVVDDAPTRCMTVVGPDPVRRAENQRRSGMRLQIAALATAALGGAFVDMGMAHDVRASWDAPDSSFTQFELDAIHNAQAKRERKAARKAALKVR